MDRRNMIKHTVHGFSDYKVHIHIDILYGIVEHRAHSGTEKPKTIRVPLSDKSLVHKWNILVVTHIVFERSWHRSASRVCLRQYG